jgi:hypothetical protein
MEAWNTNFSLCVTLSTKKSLAVSEIYPQGTACFVDTCYRDASLKLDMFLPPLGRRGRPGGAGLLGMAAIYLLERKVFSAVYVIGYREHSPH